METDTATVAGSEFGGEVSLKQVRQFNPTEIVYADLKLILTTLERSGGMSSAELIKAILKKDIALLKVYQ
jgi:hypothetical protein